MRHWVPFGGHAVAGGDGPQGADSGIGPLVAHDADGENRQQDGEGLPDLVVQPGGADFFKEDVVGLTKDVQLFFGDVAQAADGEAGAGERVTADDVFRQAEQTAEGADFIFKQVAERLEQVHVHVLRQTADVVVALDDVGAFAGPAFDNVRVQGALQEPAGAFDFPRLLFKNPDEGFADDFALPLRLDDAGEG